MSRLNLTVYTDAMKELGNYDDTQQPPGEALQIAHPIGYAQVSQVSGTWNRGDHVRLMQSDQETGTDMICLDPDLVNGRILGLINEDKGFDNRATAADFILVPQGKTPYARVRLYNEGDEDDDFPSMVFYDFQQSGNDSSIDLDKFYFRDKTHRLRLDLFQGAGSNAGVILVKDDDTAHAVKADDVTPDLQALGFQDAIRYLAFSTDVTTSPLVS